MSFLTYWSTSSSFHRPSRIAISLPSVTDPVPHTHRYSFTGAARRCASADEDEKSDSDSLNCLRAPRAFERASSEPAPQPSTEARLRSCPLGPPEMQSLRSQPSEHPTACALNVAPTANPVRRSARNRSNAGKRSRIVQDSISTKYKNKRRPSRKLAQTSSTATSTTIKAPSATARRRIPRSIRTSSGSSSSSTPASNLETSDSDCTHATTRNIRRLSVSVSIAAHEFRLAQIRQGGALVRRGQGELSLMDTVLDCDSPSADSDDGYYSDEATFELEFEVAEIASPPHSSRYRIYDSRSHLELVCDRDSFAGALRTDADTDVGSAHLAHVTQYGTPALWSDSDIAIFEESEPLRKPISFPQSIERSTLAGTSNDT